MRVVFFPFSLLLLNFGSIHAQGTISVQIDHGGLHCPYLGPKLKSQFTDHAAVDSVMINKQTSIATLYLSEGQFISDIEIADIIVHKVGYPRPEIKSIIRNEN